MVVEKSQIDPSTIYRDIKRNLYTDTEISELSGYHALVAQDKYALVAQDKYELSSCDSSQDDN